MNRMASEVGDLDMGVERYRIVGGIDIGMDVWALEYKWIDSWSFPVGIRGIFVRIV